MKPFSVFLRGNRYYVAFKNEETGKYLSAISTKKTKKEDAVRQAWVWYKEGVPDKKGITDLKTLTLYDTIRRSVVTKQDAEFLIEDLKRKGIILSCVFAGAPDAVPLFDYLDEFWDFDRSPYIREKLRAEHSIHRNYVLQNKRIIKMFWQPFFPDTLLGELQASDIERFIEHLSECKNKKGMPLSFLRKNSIIKAGTIALKRAFRKGKISKDITAGIMFFSGSMKERLILTPKLASGLFTIEWSDERSKIANMLSMVTGLRLGEILGLQYGDLGNDYINVKRSWNQTDKIKTTKNNKPRIVEVTFPYVIDILKELAGLNPHSCNSDSFIFWADRLSNKPMERKIIIDGLRKSLVACGLNEDDAKKYTFHGWRHFYTTYMRGKLDDKLLQSQTGHLSIEMLSHYSAHLRDGDRKKIRKVQREVFASLLPKK